MKFLPSALLFLIVPLCSAKGSDFAALCADHAAIERVYYNHRLGTKSSFEETMPRALVEQLVRDELHKQAVLKKVYGVEISAAQLEMEEQRINATTRAPAVLAELKTALANDRARFARTVIAPIVVARELRSRFENDDQLHSPRRRHVEATREQLLAVKKKGEPLNPLMDLLEKRYSNHVRHSVWRLGKRTEAVRAAQVDSGPAAPAVVSSPVKDDQAHFEDLAPALQKVLRAQLQQTGDVSAVLEMPEAFMLCVAKEKTDARLSAAVLSLPKLSFEAWLQNIPSEKPTP
jgi:hypothetical protein